MLKDFLRNILYRNTFTKRIMLFRKNLIEAFELAYPYYKAKMLHPKTAFLVLTPEHGNIGDHAIAKAERLLLDKLGITYIEITGKKLKALHEAGVIGVLNGSTIYVNGGGFLGTLWYQGGEALLREIIRHNPKSRIIAFPNTFYYEDSAWGKKELQKSVEIYNAHNRLTIYARDKQSYEKMKILYRDVRLMPDIVLSLPPVHANYERSGCIWCMRRDHEKTISVPNENKLKQILRSLFDNDITVTDMVEEYAVSPECRNVEIQKKLDQFSKAKLVVTDRLHAMIFCALSGTPCVVIDSKSPKVRGVYAWINNLCYIKFADSIEAFESIVIELMNMKSCQYDNTHLIPLFAQFAEEIQNR